jgi:hypothetical protein
MLKISILHTFFEVNEASFSTFLCIHIYIILYIYISGPDLAVTRIVLQRPLNLIRSHFSCIHFPPNGFAVFLTLFSKYFSP